MKLTKSSLIIFSLFSVITGCLQSSDTSEKVTGNKSLTSLQTADPSEPMVSPNARLIELGPNSAQLVPSNPTFSSSEPSKPIQELINHPDGSMTAVFGDSFTRPLMVKLDCDGELVQFHGNEATEGFAGKCGSVNDNE